MDKVARESKEEDTLRSLAEILEDTRSAFADVPEEELDREIDKAIAAARQEMVAGREARGRKVRACRYRRTDHGRGSPHRTVSCG